MGDNAHFTTVAGMIDDLRSDNREARLVAMKALTMISQTLGPDRTRNELLPYLTEYLDDDDEVLRALGGTLGHMLPEVGGPEHLNALLQPLELLCALDEVTVRDVSIASLNNLAKTAFPGAGSTQGPAMQEQQQQYLQCFTRLALSEQPQARCSACGLAAQPYRHGTAAQRKDVKAAFVKLCDDGEVMVRRAACVALGATVAEALQGAVGDFMPQFQRFCKDASDSVRLQAIPAAVGMGPHLTDAQLTQAIGLVKGLVTDSAWRVRFMLADRIGALAKAWPPKDAARVGLSIFKTLCGDQAPEIRAACVFNLDQMMSCCPNDDSKKELLAAACKLASDQQVHVRNSLGSSLLKAAAFTGADLWKQLIIPTCETLLADGESQVRLGLVTSFSAVSDANHSNDNSSSGATAAMTQAQQQALASVAKALVPAVAALAKDASWRVREVVVKQVPSIAAAAAVNGTNSEEMVSVCVDALVDRVSTIRDSACLAAQRLLETADANWGRQEFLPRVVHLAQSNNYVHRVTMVHLIALAFEVVDAGFAKADLLPILAKLSADSVPNVKLNVGKAVKVGIANHKIALSDYAVQSMIDKLAQDKDTDVRDAALAVKSE